MRLISACSVTPEVKEISASRVTEPVQGTNATEETVTTAIRGTKIPSHPGNGENITLTTSDGVQLAVDFYAPESLIDNLDVLILVHEAYRERSSWDGFRIAALENDYVVIALDLRGHGHSGGDQVFDEAMDHDIDAVLDWISASPDMSVDRVAIAGASVGANLALRAGA